MLTPDEPSSDPPSPVSETDDSLTIISSQSVSYSWQGPPPQILAQYERIVPGSADDTLREWRKAMTHQREIEKDKTRAVSYNIKWAPAYRLVTIIVVIAGGLLAVLLGEPAMGWFLGLGAALSYPVGSALIRILRGRDNEAQSDHSTDS